MTPKDKAQQAFERIQRTQALNKKLREMGIGMADPNDKRTYLDAHEPATFDYEPATPPATTEGDECTPEQLAYGRKVVVLDWLQWGNAWDERMAELALEHMAHLEASNSELLAEVKRGEEEIARLRKYLDAIKWEAEQSRHLLAGIIKELAREALGDRDTTSPNTENRDGPTRV